MKPCKKTPNAALQLLAHRNLTKKPLIGWLNFHCKSSRSKATGYFFFDRLLPNCFELGCEFSYTEPVADGFATDSDHFAPLAGFALPPDE